MTNTARIIQGVQKFRLENGLTVLAREDHTVPIVTTMVWYRVGSRFEKPGITGVSHFLEHMMFKGTRRYGKGEIDYITTRNGGSNNAFTANDYTAYYFSFASDRWHSALEVEADRMNNSLIDPEEFRLEKQVVLEELKMEFDDPWGALRLAVEAASFSAHPYRYPIIGLPEDIAGLTQRQMVDHYRKYYVPSNAVLVLAGDFKTKKALGLVKKLFGPISTRPAPVSETAPEEQRTSQVRVQLSRPSKLNRLLVAFPAPSVHQPAHYTLHVLDKILAEGKLSRLYQRLIEKEAAVSFLSSDFTDTFEPYLYMFRIELLPGVSAEKVESGFFEELRRLAQEPVAAAELERSKRQCILNLLTGFETTLDQAVQLGLLETLDRYEYWRDYGDRIGAVSAQDIMDYARAYLVPERATIGTLLNEKRQSAST